MNESAQLCLGQSHVLGEEARPGSQSNPPVGLAMATSRTFHHVRGTHDGPPPLTSSHLSQ